MSDKRKDDKGRILKTGESQRKDSMYQYRYTDGNGKRRTIYSKDLHELREKENEINEYRYVGVDYAAGGITVIELVERYLGLKKGAKYNTQVNYTFVLNLIKKEAFGRKIIRDIKISDAKQWFVKLQSDGRGYSTICTVRGVVKPAFQMACDEDCIRKNPFVFKLTDVIKNDSKKRIALTSEQEATWMDFIKNDITYCKYYDEFVVLLGTGMRVSEFCGLTKKDIDFELRRIRVDHQLVRERSGKYYVEKTKTESGCRFIPMTEEVYTSLKNIVKNRRKVKNEMIVDGYGQFILIDKKEQPKVALHIENEIRWSLKKYARLNPNKPLPNITPHVLRHTFCTKMAYSGMDVKSLQYIMGHSEVGVTLNVYTHASYEKAEEQMNKVNITTPFTTPLCR